QEQLRSLKTRVTSFCSLCQSCLSNADAGVCKQVCRGWGGRGGQGTGLALSPSLCPQAFVVLSDLLLVFGPQLPRDGWDALAPLVLLPDAGLQAQLAAFLMDHVFHHSSSHEELLPMEDTENRIEELHQRRVLLAGFCKLIIYNVLELSAASDVFKHYAKFYSDYGDIIKETLNRTRQIDRQEWARTLLLSLQQVWDRLGGLWGVPGVVQEALRVFGESGRVSRGLRGALGREGIQFAFQEPPGPGPGLPPLNLPFLEVLSEFSPRLLRSDKA
ncbi:STAG3 protein, partial [Himantopus himantopus]|nr:STAG3 protein [Himantopus himantopus]